MGGCCWINDSGDDRLSNLGPIGAPLSIGPKCCLTLEYCCEARLSKKLGRREHILDLFDRKHVPTDPFQGDKKMSGELPRALTLVSNFFLLQFFLNISILNLASSNWAQVT